MALGLARRGFDKRDVAAMLPRNLAGAMPQASVKRAVSDAHPIVNQGSQNTHFHSQDKEN